ncbi:MAG: glycosyltransferase family 39 protein [Bryobacteraceae bacterium]
MKSLSLVEASWRVRCAVFLAIFALLLATRWPLAPQYLFFFDSVNFALALEQFNPGLHQPQPPGYPLFVGLTKVLHLLVPRVEDVFVVSGIIGAAVAVYLLWLLGEMMFGARAGFTSALLLLVNPVLWFSGLSNQVRVYLATAGVAVALLAWRAWPKASPVRWFYLTALVLGLAAGFRPLAAVLLAPLLLLTGLRSRRSLGQFLVAGLLSCAAVASWLFFTASKVGGLAGFIDLLRSYSQDQFQVSSLLYGAQLTSALGMAENALIWNALAFLPWIWALPFVFRSTSVTDGERYGLFLAAWFVPAFLFHALVHVAHPDHVLITIPVGCLLGGRVLSALSQSGDRKNRWAYAAAAACAVSLFLFFKPPSDPIRLSSYKAIRDVDRTNSAAFESLRDMARSSRLFVITYQFPVSWRQVAYYFPDQPLLVLNTPIDSASETGNMFQFLHGEVGDPKMTGNAVALPLGARVVILLPPDPRLKEILQRQIPLSSHGPLLYTDVKAGTSFKFGSYSFKTR